MEIYSLDDLNLREIKALRKSLDFLPITGIDAMFIALLQNKVQSQVNQIENHLKKEEEEKQKALREAVKNDPQPSSQSPRETKKS